MPRHEMEMCVHATVATIVLLAREGRAVSIVETPLGLRRATVEPAAGQAMIEQSKPVFGPVLDDPACALAAQLTAESGDDGWNAWTIAQGRAMGRPSIIRAESRLVRHEIVATRVGGAMRVLGGR